MLNFIIGLLCGVSLSLLSVWIAKKQTASFEEEAEEKEPPIGEGELEAYRKYEEDMIRQMRNILRYDGTTKGQEGADDEE